MIGDNCHFANIVVVWVQELDCCVLGECEERDFLSSFNVGHGYSVVLHQVLNITWIRGQIPGEGDFCCTDDSASKVEGNNCKKATPKLACDKLMPGH